MHTGIYIRVSTEEQARDGFSIHAQQEKLTKYAEANDWEIVDYYIDDGISGKNLKDRPEINRLLTDIKKEKINHILIYKLDRLTRSVRDLISLIEFFEENEITFHSQTEKIDTSNAVGRMFIKIIGIFAEFERENLAERVSLGYEQKTREGNYTNTNGVYGYDYVKKEQKLLVNEKEKELVVRIFDLYIEGASYFKIAKILNEENIPTKRGGTWAPSTIKSILTNPLYIGKVRYGVSPKYKKKSFVVLSKKVSPLLSFSKWSLAQELITTRQKQKYRRYPSDKNYYFPLLTCACCGSKLIAKTQKKNDQCYITYRCPNNIKGLCPSSGFSSRKMEESFLKYLERIEEFVVDNKLFKKEENKEEQNLKQKLKRGEHKKKEILKQYVNANITIEEYRNMKTEIDLHQDLYKKKLKKVIKEQQESLPKSEIKKVLGKVNLNWQYLTRIEKRQFLERFVDKIIVRKEKNTVIVDKIKFK